MKVINNLLFDLESKQIEQTLSSPNFPWYLNRIFKEKDRSSKVNYELTHIFYIEHNFNSQYSDIIKLIYNKIKWSSLIRAKANLQYKTDHIVEHGFHCDYVEKNIKTAIFYVNTNNGYTKFKNNKKVKSERNKFVEFDSTNEHSGTTCTDKDFRIVINFNYFK